MDMTILPPQEAMGMPARKEMQRTVSRRHLYTAHMHMLLVPLSTRYAELHNFMPFSQLFTKDLCETGALIGMIYLYIGLSVLIDV